MRGVKLKDRIETATLNFDVNAKLEEKDRKSGMRVIGFVLTVGTKPSVAKFEVEGIVTIEGKNPDIDKLLEVNPKSKIPLLLNRVYQSVFTSTYLLANLLDTSYPPPDMLYSGELNKKGAEGHVEWGERKEPRTEEKPTPTKEAVEETPPPTQETVEETPPQTDEAVEETPTQTNEVVEEAPPPANEAVEETPPPTQETVEESPTATDEAVEEMPPQTDEAVEETPPPTDEAVDETAES